VKRGVLHAVAPAEALMRIVALRVHVDDSTAENGPLRVLPGTHVSGVLSRAAIVEVARRVESVECTVASGGVVAMRPLLVHASSKSLLQAPRRVLHVEYADTTRMGQGLELEIA
jgi:ectoine hydroxylase-related dioxygenase (phytanoyl-CoA dioxygenase family)